MATLAADFAQLSTAINAALSDFIERWNPSASVGPDVQAELNTANEALADARKQIAVLEAKTATKPVP